MKSIQEVVKLDKLVTEWKKNNNTIALVPTMGSLHFGHISLIKEAKKLASKTVVSIFVNPIQFGRGEDYESYPSHIDSDKKIKRSRRGCSFYTRFKATISNGN